MKISELLTPQQCRILNCFAEDFLVSHTGDVHTLMVGAAGVGKTAFFLYPNLEFACASGMSFVSTDCKGDVFRNYGTIAKNHYGYHVSVLDLRNPTRSDENNILHTFVKEMRGNTAVTDSGSITAKAVIVTTHFPFINKHGSYFLKLYQHRSYVLALENAQDVSGMYVDECRTGLSFRNYGKYLLLGGGGHRTGKKGGNWTELRQFARTHYPDAQEYCHWAAQDCMTLDDIPYIGQYSGRTAQLFTATGFNKWGMTGAMVAAQLLFDMVLGKQNEFADVFSPSRSILRPQLLVNGFEAVTNLLTFTGKRCPHLGCALKWNKAEHSWDCACHGSRFDENGRVLDNPANGK